MNTKNIPQKPWHSMTLEETLIFFDVDKISGLNSREVDLRRKKFGFSETGKAFNFNTDIFRIRVLRDGTIKDIRPNSLVLGDIVELKQGDIVFNDLRLIKVSKLKVNQSSITGSDAPSFKNTYPVIGSKSVEDQLNMVYPGSVIVDGSGMGVVVNNTFNHSLLLKQNARRRKVFEQRQINKLSKQGIIINNRFPLKSLKNIDCLLLSLPIEVDLIVELIRSIVSKKGISLSISVDMPTYLSLKSKIGGLTSITKKDFDSLSNKALMQLDGPIIALVDVGYEELSRYLRIKSLKDENVSWLDKGEFDWPLHNASISIAIAKYGCNYVINEADVVLDEISSESLVRKINQII